MAYVDAVGHFLTMDDGDYGRNSGDRIFRRSLLGKGIVNNFLDGGPILYLLGTRKIFFLIFG